MREIRLSEAARADLIDIWITTCRTWGADQAGICLDDIDRALDGLIVHPFRGADCSALFHGARRLVAGRDLAFYEVPDDAVFVLRVLRQAMDVKRDMLRD